MAALVILPNTRARRTCSRFDSATAAFQPSNPAPMAALVILPTTRASTNRCRRISTHIDFQLSNPIVKSSVCVPKMLSFARDDLKTFLRSSASCTTDNDHPDHP